MSRTSIISSAFERHKKTVEESMRQIVPDVERAAKLVASALKKGNKVLACGNGGSAADSSHFMEELIGRYKENRRPLPAVALSGDGVFLTVIGNDFGYDHIFSRQVEALGQNGDVLAAFSTSGTSANVINAIKAARKKKMKVVLFTGEKGAPMRKQADIAIVIPTKETARIQEMHVVAYHAMCEYVDSALFGL
jgi:D-sedoheptulose 7-phosphate isomerase